MLPHINGWGLFWQWRESAFLSKIANIRSQVFWPSSQSYSLGEDLKYRAAETEKAW